MSNSKAKKYDEFVKAFCEANPNSSKKEQYAMAQRMWNSVKSDENLVNTRISEFKLKVAKSKAKNLDMWSKFHKKTSAPSSVSSMPNQVSAASNPNPDLEKESPLEKDSDKTTKVQPTQSNSDANKLKRETPTQNKLKEEIGQLDSQIAGMKAIQNSGLSAVSHKEVRELCEKRKEKEKNLKRLENKAKIMSKLREKKSQQLKSFCEANPEAAKALKSLNKSTPGRPRLETSQPQLLSTILDIVQSFSASAEKRRTNELRSVLTLDDLVRELQSRGHKISRSATYIRLLPKRFNTNQAKHHVETVPVRLLR